MTFWIPSRPLHWLVSPGRDGWRGAAQYGVGTGGRSDLSRKAVAGGEEIIPVVPAHAEVNAGELRIL
jgi:hypothetical protein